LRGSKRNDSQSFAKEISPTGEGVNHIVKKGAFKSFKPFNRCAPFKPLLILRPVPIVPEVPVVPIVEQIQETEYFHVSGILETAAP
jgi:hypothetical protein